MTQEELLNLVHSLRSNEDCSDEQLCEVIKAANQTITIENLNNLFKQSERQEASDDVDVLNFTQKEILRMPKTFRKEFKTAGCTARVYKRKSGKETWNYVICYRRNGYNVIACSNNLEEAKRKFIEKLKEADAIKRAENCGYMVVPIPYASQQAVGATAQPAYVIQPQGNVVYPVQQAQPAATAQTQEPPKEVNGVPATFDKFANYYFENFHKRKVCAETYRITQSNYKNHVLPHFGDVQMSTITPNKCQELLDKLIDEDKVRTEENVFTMLNTLFTAAVKHGIVQHNPMDMVFHTKHDREHGKALTKEEEKKLLEVTAGTPYQKMFAVAIYTGLRPNEYKTAEIVGDFIVANNSKRKNGKVESKKIPITPMLKPYLEDGGELHFVWLEQIRNKMKQILPDHKLYDMRTTFYTRCTDCVQ